MAVTPMPRVPGPAVPAAEPASPERKGGADVATDATFASLLIGLLGLPAPVVSPAQPAGGDSPSGAADTLPQAVESFLQAQRVQPPAEGLMAATLPSATVAAVALNTTAPVSADMQAEAVPDLMPDLMPGLMPDPMPGLMTDGLPEAMTDVVTGIQAVPPGEEATTSVPTVPVPAPGEAVAETIQGVPLQAPSLAAAAEAPGDTAEERSEPEQAAEVTFTPLAPASGTALRQADEPAPAKAPAPIPTPIDPERLMEAIARSAATGKDGRYTVTLRLHPEQLGEVRLQMQLVGREVSTQLHVTNPAARQALEQSSHLLRQGLGESGLTLSGFHVSTEQGDRRGREQEWPDDGRPADRRRSREVPAARAAAVQAPASRRRAGAGLDTLA